MGPVTVFVRPEQCRLTEPGTPSSIPARVAFSVYQGSYAELYLDCPAAASGRVMLRVPAATALAPGVAVAIALPEQGAAVYAREDVQ